MQAQQRMKKTFLLKKMKEKKNKTPRKIEGEKMCDASDGCNAKIFFGPQKVRFECECEELAYFFDFGMKKNEEKNETDGENNRLCRERQARMGVTN
jgi:hypothetical protein